MPRTRAWRIEKTKSSLFTLLDEVRAMPWAETYDDVEDDADPGSYDSETSVSDDLALRWVEPDKSEPPKT